MAKSWSGFAPQNQTAKKQWKLLEITQALAPDLMLIPADPDEQGVDSQEDEDLPARVEASAPKGK